jgi:hypothetical protein
MKSRFMQFKKINYNYLFTMVTVVMKFLGKCVLL